MKRIGRKPPRRIFSRAETTRLMMLILFLVVLAMLIRSTANPDLWKKWVDKGDEQHVGDKGAAPEIAPSSKAAANGSATIDSGSRASATKVPSAPAPAIPPASPLRPEPNRDAVVAQATPPANPAPTAPQPTPSAAPKSPDVQTGVPEDTTAISNGKQPGAVGNLPTKPAPEGDNHNTAPPAAADATAKARPPPQATGPTDEDPDEQGAAMEDYAYIEDANAVRVQEEESQAYERIVRWVTNQPYAYLLSRAQPKNAKFGEFIEAPAEHRRLGKLYQFDLELRALQPFPEAFTFDHSDSDPHDPIALYGAWGSMDAAHGRLFSLVIVDPPKGMPLGDMLRENVHFVGYFFKILAYEPYRTLPGGKLLKAPILIGRIQWLRPGPAPLIGSNDLILAIALGGGALLILIVWTGSVVLAKRRNLAPQATERSLPPSVTIDDWLEHAESGDLKSDDEPPPLVIDNRDAPHGSNGHAKESGKTRAEE